MLAHDPPTSRQSGAGKKLRTAVDSVRSTQPLKATPLEAARRAFKPSVPPVLLGACGGRVADGGPTTCVANAEAIKERFPNLYGQSIVELCRVDAPQGDANRKPLKVGCVLSGGQAAGGHNCICGLYDYVNAHYPGSVVYGFLGGPKGVMTNSFKLLDAKTIDDRAALRDLTSGLPHWHAHTSVARACLLGRPQLRWFHDARLRARQDRDPRSI